MSFWARLRSLWDRHALPDDPLEAPDDPLEFRYTWACPGCLTQGTITVPRFPHEPDYAPGTFPPGVIRQVLEQHVTARRASPTRGCDGDIDAITITLAAP